MTGVVIVLLSAAAFTAGRGYQWLRDARIVMGGQRSRRGRS